jgi:hypothetical protein
MVHGPRLRYKYRCNKFAESNMSYHRMQISSSLITVASLTRLDSEAS